MQILDIGSSERGSGMGGRVAEWEGARRKSEKGVRHERGEGRILLNRALKPSIRSINIYKCCITLRKRKRVGHSLCTF